MSESKKKSISEPGEGGRGADSLEGRNLSGEESLGKDPPSDSRGGRGGYGNQLGEATEGRPN